MDLVNRALVFFPFASLMLAAIACAEILKPKLHTATYLFLYAYGLCSGLAAFYLAFFWK